MRPVIVWFRQDLRLADNAALTAAAKTGAPLIGLYILDDDTPGKWRLGGASRWWLHASLESLEASLRKLGATLTLRRGKADVVLASVVEETNAASVFYTRNYEPFAVTRDQRVATHLKRLDVTVEAFGGDVLFEPGTIRTGAGEPFRMFTPYWRACRAAPEPEAPAPAPRKLSAPAKLAKSDSLADWELQPTKPDWAKGLRATWTPGEAGARKRLQEFFDGGMTHYLAARDEPATVGTSMLSPHLHFGEISPRQLWHAVKMQMHTRPRVAQAGEKLLAELGWREFSHSLMVSVPTLAEKNMRSEFDAFPWRKDEKAFKAWTRGRTGYPIVDAGMRQLWQTGWMHNRVRMIAASFLVKDLLLPWQRGAAWFWDTLVDADLGNNSVNWQWVAGSGVDAAPYFRIFNPVLQGEKFDPQGAYVREFVPELKDLPDHFVHRPWDATPAELAAAKVRLGRDYPDPIVDHTAARTRALAALKSIKARD